MNDQTPEAAATGAAGVAPLSFDDFKAQAAALYQQTRDEAREVVVLLLAAALGEAYYAGQTYVINRQLLALMPDAPDQAPTLGQGFWGPAGALKRHQ